MAAAYHGFGRGVSLEPAGVLRGGAAGLELETECGSAL